MAPKPKKPESKSSTGEISATVEESNALRASLGLRPLEAKDSKSKSGTSNAPIHVDTTAVAPESDKDKKRAAAAAKTRKDHAELVSGKGLGDILGEEEGKGGASDWVARTRNKDGSMKAASTAAGSKDSSKQGGKDAVPKMKVRHDASQLPDGEGVTLTLSDRPILDADGNINDEADELSNVRMVDDEKAKHNEAVKNKVEYDPSKEGASLLDKYDEVKTGPAGFTIGGSGSLLDETDPEKKLAMLTAMSEKQSLEMKTKLQSDFYTSEEMAKFKKPSKKPKKKRKAEASKEDQIGNPKLVAEARPEDAGSDEEDPELYEQLSKQRRLVRRSDTGAVKKGEAALGAVSEKIQALDNDDDKDEKEKALIGIKPAPGKEAEAVSMTATTEFCNVVQTPLEKMDTVKHESFRGSTLYKQQATQRKGIAAGERKARKAGVALDADDLDKTKDVEDENTLAEDGLDLTCASGLAYLRARSQIGNDQESHKHRKSDNRPLEMSTVDGDIKLEYRDDFGRVQTPKEAFRAISWKFHGKTPGRKNMERRLLRLENEMKLKAMDPLQQLPTLRALRHVQNTDAKPYMVLSGANEK